MTRREQVALAVLVLGLAWFAYPAKEVSADLSQHRAEALRGTSVEDLVKAVLVAPIGQLPAGEDGQRAGAALEEAIALHELQAGWTDSALAVLSEESLEIVGTERAIGGERSRSHPHTPASMLEMVSLLVEAHGPAGVPLPEPPETSPLPGLPPEELSAGLLALVRGETLSADEARGVLSATLAGIGAHERSPVLIEELEELLGDEVVALSESAPSPRDRHELARMGQAAVSRLKER